MLTGEGLAARREEIAGAPELGRLLERLRGRARPVLEREPPFPEVKALLSTDGGVCPRDGAALIYDPWSPQAHRCPRCGEQQSGERHHRWWARFQHLWLAERAAHLAALAAFGDDDDAADRGRALLRRYGERYAGYPNRDNVLGPSRLFFSTYLESIWLTNLLAAAVLLREAGALDPETAQGVDTVADEAAALIGDFNEGFSNRQTWHDAALAAVAVWFEDEELLRGAVEGPTGLVAHAMQGFGPDGMWYEGENYHLFALRGLLVGLDWVRAAGFDPLEEAGLADRLQRALLAPALTALPDGTFPARKDSRFGMSLAQPMYLELWERGRAAAFEGESPLGDWLAALYGLPAPPAETFDSYLHEAGEPPPDRRGRADLSWWMLLAMPALGPGAADRWRPGSVLLDSQGLAVLRTGGRYASLECGAYGGGHGHPDRLHLSLHEAGVHWLPDPGTGSYVARDLFWYRSTLAHNAPRLDGVSQAPGDAVCEHFDVADGWSWVQGSFGPLCRTIVAGPAYLVDIVELSSDTDRLLEVPWHVAGAMALRSPGQWEPAMLEDEFTRDAERFLPAAGGPIELEARAPGARLAVALAGPGELLRAVGPGVPGEAAASFLLRRARGDVLRLVSVVSTADPAPRLRIDEGYVEVITPAGGDRHRAVAGGWEVEGPGGTVRLGGRRPAAATMVERILTVPRSLRQHGVAVRVARPPALDGTLDGFDLSYPLSLDHEDQYRRSEEPYAGAEVFGATAYANWDDDTLYLAVEVTKPEVVLRPADAPPLLLDNEPDDIHSDGLQLYVRAQPEAATCGAVVVPAQGGTGVHARPVQGPGDELVVAGSWSATETGYRLTVALRPAGWGEQVAGDRVRFDLLVNEMRSGRERRAGQLVWSGGGGWVWLRGDRQGPDQLGELELV
ncbi:MAG TPA: heparinase II/III family protein [Gemmatimonadales bacterium]|nr:heparinase II/III family protein [Gemmatimonadales bacterium]